MATYVLATKTQMCFKEFLESLWYRLVMSMQPLEHSTIEEF